MSPTDAQLPLCSAGGYGEKQGEEQWDTAIKGSAHITHVIRLTQIA